MVTPPPTSWSPLDIFSPTPVHHAPFALIILNQALKLPPYLYHQLWSNSTLIIAADGGANRLHDLNTTLTTPLSLDAIIGDLDSLLPDIRSHWEEKGIPVIHDPDQYSTDFTKAVNYIRADEKRKGIDIVVLGGLGGRVDQALSVLHHLYLFQTSPRYEDGRMCLLSSEAVTFVLKKGEHCIKAKEKWSGIGGGVALGKHVGILPLKGESVITTEGLEWDVKDWKTVFGGNVSTSNHVKEEKIWVETSEGVLFTIDLKFDGDG